MRQRRLYDAEQVANTAKASKELLGAPVPRRQAAPLPGPLLQ